MDLWTSIKEIINKICINVGLFKKSKLHTQNIQWERWCVCVWCVCVLSVSHYVPALSAISHCSVNRKIQHFLVLISLSEQMMPEIFILFIMEFQWPLLQIKWKFLHIKWEKLNVNHVLMWLRVTGTLFLLIIHRLEGSNKAKEQAMFVLFLLPSIQGGK